MEDEVRKPLKMWEILEQFPKQEWKREMRRNGIHYRTNKKYRCIDVFQPYNDYRASLPFIMDDLCREYKFKRGDIVTLKDAGGEFAVVEIPPIYSKDVRTCCHNYHDAVWEYANVYWLAGLIDGVPAGTEFLSEEHREYIYISDRQCFEENLLPHPEHHRITEYPHDHLIWSSYIGESDYLHFYDEAFSEDESPVSHEILIAHDIRHGFKYSPIK